MGNMMLKLLAIGFMLVFLFFICEGIKGKPATKSTSFNSQFFSFFTFAAETTVMLCHDSLQSQWKLQSKTVSAGDPSMPDMIFDVCLVLSRGSIQAALSVSMIDTAISYSSRSLPSSARTQGPNELQITFFNFS